VPVVDPVSPSLRSRMESSRKEKKRFVSKATKK